LKKSQFRGHWGSSKVENREKEAYKGLTLSKANIFYDKMKPLTLTFEKDSLRAIKGRSRSEIAKKNKKIEIVNLI